MSGTVSLTLFTTSLVLTTRYSLLAIRCFERHDV